MRHVRRSSLPRQWRAGILPACALFLLGCYGELLGQPPPTVVGTTPICEASDPTNVIANQRIALITSTQIVNAIKQISETEAKTLVDTMVYEVVSDIRLRFPPAREEKLKSIVNSTELAGLDIVFQHVRDFVRDNFSAVTMCAAPAMDTCATNFLNGLARKMYRRRLTTEEQARFTALYNKLRNQDVNGCHVSLNVEAATGNAVYALLMSPQFLWRWELGGGAVSTSPPGLYLTDAELASNLSFFLTDRGPDDELLAAADGGTLRTNLASHVDRILLTQTSREWLTKVTRTYFYLNTLQGVVIDPTVVPIVAGGAVYADLEQESKLFVDDVLWNGKVMDFITSRKAFLNTNLATMVYDVPVPSGATDMNFAETMLPADKRAGLLTNAGFITTKARSDGVGIVPRGLAVKATFLCLETPPPPPSINMPGGAVDMQKAMLATMTAQQQVEFRRNDPVCSNCHPSFDPYALVLDWYDAIGRYRTTDHLNMPIDGTTTLPAMAGGKTIDTAVELAQELSGKDLFVNCMSQKMLQFGLIDTAIELPVPLDMQKGCAAAGVANEVRRSSKQSFSDLIRAIATSPAFLMRKQVP